MNIHAQIWISDVNDKVANITPNDCTLYEEDFADAKAFSNFILDHLEASEINHGAVEQIMLSVDEGKLINAYKLTDSDLGIDQWNFQEDGVQCIVDEYLAFIAKEEASMEAILCNQEASLSQQLKAISSARGLRDLDLFFFGYYVAYLAYLIKVHRFATKTDLRTLVIESTTDKRMRDELFEALEEVGIENLQILASQREAEDFKDYLENAWSDDPDSDIYQLDATGLDELMLQVLDTQPDEKMLNINYGEGRFLMEVSKAQPTAEIIAIHDDIRFATVAHIKLELAKTIVKELPSDDVSLFRRKNEDLMLDKICIHPYQLHNSFIPSIVSARRESILAQLSDKGKAIAFVDRNELMPQFRRQYPVKEFVRTGLLEAVVLLSDDYGLNEYRHAPQGLAMLIFSQNNESVRIVDAAEIIDQAQEERGFTLRTVVPKNCVAQIVGALSESVPYSYTFTNDKIAQAHFIIDPKTLPLCCESDDEFYPLRLAYVGGGSFRWIPSRRNKKPLMETDQAKSDSFFKIGIDDIEGNTIILDEKCAESESQRPSFNSVVLAKGEVNYLIIPIERDVITGTFSAGTVLALKNTPTDRTCFIDDPLLLMNLDKEKADANRVADFLNSEQGHNLLNVALRRSEYDYTGSSPITSIGLVLSGNLLISESVFEPGFEASTPRLQKPSQRSSSSPEAMNSTMDKRRRFREALRPKGDEQHGAYRLKDEEFDPKGVMEGIAGNPETPPELLDILAHKATKNIQKMIAQNPATDTETLIFLASKPWGEKAMLNPKLPVSFLEKQAQNMLRYNHRREVAANPSTPPYVLEHLASDENGHVREAVAKNASTPSATLNLLISDIKPIRKMALNNPQFPRTTLEKLATSEDARARFSAAGSSQASEQLLDRLADDEDDLVRYEATSNEGMSTETLERLSHHPDPITRMLVAKHPHASEQIVERLAHDETMLSNGEAQVRFGAIGSKYVPVWLLEELAESDDPKVRFSVARSSCAPQGVLDKLAHDKDPKIRMAVAGNPISPSSALEALSEDYITRVKIEVTKNPAAPKEVIEQLAEDPIDTIRSWVARRRDITSEMQEQFMTDSYDGVRYFLVQNPSTASEIRSTLAKDPNRAVAAAAIAGLPLEELQHYIAESGLEKPLVEDQS